MPRINCRFRTKCSIGLLQSPGTQLQNNKFDLDTASVVFTCDKGHYKSLQPDLGDRYPGGKYPRLYCCGTTVNFGAGFAKITARYKGFIESATAKAPTGGPTRSTREVPIQLHPNYIKRPDTWIKNKWIFGDGPSPNAFGRITDDQDGTFKFFGPLPKGERDQPDAAAQCPGNSPEERGVCNLMGIENFLTEGNIQYSYSAITAEDWITDKLNDTLGRIVTPVSRLVPVPALKDNGNWLFTNCNVEAVPLSRSASYYRTTVEFTSSGPGGWNTYLYRPGGDLRLDNLIGRIR